MIEYILYENGMSIPQVSRATGIARSTLRFRYKRSGILRTRQQGVRLAAAQGRIVSPWKGGTRPPFTEEHKRRMSEARLAWADKHATGLSTKPSGYIEITRGENKGRSQHCVIMEQQIGRRLYRNECVHHINGDKSDNKIDNLRLMTVSDHIRLHALERKITRDELGRIMTWEKE